MIAGSPRAITSGSRPRFEVGRDELIDRAGREPIPAAEPIAGAADDRDHAPGVGPFESRGIFDPRGDALAIGEEVAEIVGNLGLEDVAASVAAFLSPAREATRLPKPPGVVIPSQAIPTFLRMRRA